MSLYKRGETWYVYVTVNGQRIRQSTGTSNKKQAEAIHDKIKHDAKQVKDAGKTLNDALKLWLLARTRSDREKSAIRVFLKAYPNRSLSRIYGHDILDATAHYNPSTYNRTANIIRASISLAHARGWCNNIKIYRRKTDPTRLRFLTKDEWHRLEKELPEHVRNMARFAILTGLRQANVLGLQWESIDLENRVAWVDSPDTKSKKSLSVPLNSSAMRLLDILSESTKQGSVFRYNGKPVKSVKTAWNKALIRTKIDLVTKQDKKGNDYITSTFRFHDLRHTWASWHVQNGTPLAVLKELGGWSSMDMVLRYAHLSPEHLRQYVDNV